MAFWNILKTRKMGLSAALPQNTEAPEGAAAGLTHFVKNCPLPPEPREIKKLPITEDIANRYARLLQLITDEKYAPFFPNDLLHAQLLIFFQKKGVRLYDWSETHDYLEKKARIEKRETNNRGLLPSSHVPGPYHNFVPFRVLETVQELIGELGAHIDVSIWYADTEDCPAFARAYAGRYGSSIIFDFWMGKNSEVVEQKPWHTNAVLTEEQKTG